MNMQAASPGLPPYLSEEALDTLLRQALAEDVGPGDVTTAATVPADRPARGVIYMKEEGVVAGLEAARRVFLAVDATAHVDWRAGDGMAMEADATVGIVEGAARGLLTAERLALNLLQRMSGIATATHRMVEAVYPYGTEILDTRKTAPGLRLLDKWAVRLGGGTNHRLGLYDQILIKDNHIAAAGGIPAALEAARRYRETWSERLPIEIETRTLAEVRTVLEAGGADIILLDNMATYPPDGTVDTDVLQQAVDLIGDRTRTEASGNVTLKTAPPIARTGVDAISSGSLTHSVRALDLAMKMEL